MLVKITKVCYTTFSKAYVPGIRPCNQSCEHIIASMVSGSRLQRYSSSILLALEKADSEATVETGTLSTSRAIRERIGYFGPLIRHQAKISKQLLPISGQNGFSR